jgi:hypothetical protein
VAICVESRKGAVPTSDCMPAGFSSPLISRVEDWRRLPRRLSLSVTPRFLWECLTSRTVGRFPVPATSNPACGFPALGFPAGFTPRVMRPIMLDWLSAPTPPSARSARSPTSQNRNYVPRGDPHAGYTAAWRGQNIASVATFDSLNGSLCVNHSPPTVLNLLPRWRSVPGFIDRDGRLGAPGRQGIT